MKLTNSGYGFLSLVVLFCLTVALGISAYSVSAEKNSELRTENRILKMFRPEAISPSTGVYVRSQKLWGDDAASLDSFGSCVAVSGDTVVVGALTDDISSNTDQGSVSVYVRDGDSWEFQQKLTAPDGATDDQFGFSCDVDGDTIVVGTWQHDHDEIEQSGAAYIFVRSGSTWSFQRELIGTVDFSGDTINGVRFGHSVSVSGDYVVAGEPHDRVTDSNQMGSASLFLRDGGDWTRLQKFAGSEAFSHFGYSVDISSNRIIVGAPQQDPSNRGAAFIYAIEGFGSTQLNGTINSNGFGRSVTIDGDIAAIGSLTLQAKVHVSEYSGSSWGTPIDLNPSNSFGGSFGYSVSVTGDLLVVGAPGSGPRSIHVFRKINGDWVNRAELKHPETPAQQGECLGVSVGANNRTIVGGAVCDSYGGTGGAASVWFNVPPLQFDFDGDALANISVRRPGATPSPTPLDDTWYVRLPGGGFTTKDFGVAGDLSAPADFDGDGKTDIAVFRPSNGTWYVQGTTQGFFTNTWGEAGDIPVPSDLNGDGKADFVVFRPSNNTWYWKYTYDLSFGDYQFGQTGDIPIIGDFDGNQRFELAVFRPSTGGWLWYDLQTSSGGSISGWGTNGDIPTPGDFDGDLRTDAVVFRPSDSKWYRRFSSTGGTSSTTWGQTGDIPVAADYDGDGEVDMAVFRPSNNNWYIINSSYGQVPLTTQTSTVSFGASGDIPVPAAFLP